MDEIIVAANPPIIGIAVRLTNSIGEIFATPAQARTTPETGENERKIPADNCIGIASVAVDMPRFVAAAGANPDKLKNAAFPEPDNNVTIPMIETSKIIIIDEFSPKWSDKCIKPSIKPIVSNPITKICAAIISETTLANTSPMPCKYTFNEAATFLPSFVWIRSNNIEIVSEKNIAVTTSILIDEIAKRLNVSNKAKGRIGRIAK